MKKEFEVHTHKDPLNVRSGPGMSYKVLKRLAKGTKVMAHEEKNGWYKHDKGGWSSGKYLKLIKDYDPPKTKKVTQKKNDNSTDNGPDGNYNLSETEILNMKQFSNSSASDTFDELRVVHGLPFQFLETADPRPAKCAYGRTFLETILQDGSFLYMIPGKPEFFTGLSKKSKNSLITGMIGNDETHLKQLVNDVGGRYYTFSTDFVNYQNYVAAMCRSAAYFLGLQNVKGYESNTKYKDFDWGIAANTKTNEKGKTNLGHNTDFVGNLVNNPIYKEMAQNPCVCVYIDGNSTSYSESVSNSTEESMITGVLNKGSEATREARFLFGGMGNVPDSKLVEGSMKNVESVIKGLVSSFKKNVVLDQFTEMGKAVIYGGNILIPDIWKDSSYSKSYNIDIKLVSPYGNLESIYLHILVPLFHIMALSFPRQLGRSGYMSPFLVRAFCKGWFNCDMGIVESFQIKKASQDGWNSSGLPTEIDVSISLRDLYSSIGISSATDSSYLKNTEFLDMIGTLCGINVNKPAIDRKLAMLVGFYKNKPGDIVHNVTASIGENIRNKLNNLIR